MSAKSTSIAALSSPTSLPTKATVSAGEEGELCVDMVRSQLEDSVVRQCDSFPKGSRLYAPAVILDQCHQLIRTCIGQAEASQWKAPHMAHGNL